MDKILFGYASTTSRDRLATDSLSGSRRTGRIGSVDAPLAALLGHGCLVTLQPDREGVPMRDFIGLLFLILAGMLVTKHFALGIPPFLIAFGLMGYERGSASTSDGAAILGGLGLLSMIAIILYAIFD